MNISVDGTHASMLLFARFYIYIYDNSTSHVKREHIVNHADVNRWLGR